MIAQKLKNWMGYEITSFLGFLGRNIYLTGLFFNPRDLLLKVFSIASSRALTFRKKLCF